VLAGLSGALRTGLWRVLDIVAVISFAGLAAGLLFPKKRLARPELAPVVLSRTGQGEPDA
jgi:hypothetical protein